MSSSRDEAPLSAGYSVLEVLVTVGVLAALSAMSAYGVREIGQQMEIGATAARLSSSLKQWRERSIHQSRAIVVLVEPRAARLSVGDEVTELGRGVIVQRLDATNLTSVLTFLPDGSSSGAHLAVSSARWRFELRIDPFDGSIGVLR